MAKRKKLQWARSVREKEKEWELKEKVGKYKEEKKKKIKSFTKVSRILNTEFLLVIIFKYKIKIKKQQVTSSYTRLKMNIETLTKLRPSLHLELLLILQLYLISNNKIVDF